jgi:PAS domain S-box/diguanylate cyclase (GGDEF) domain
LDKATPDCARLLHAVVGGPSAPDGSIGCGAAGIEPVPGEAERRLRDFAAAHSGLFWEMDASLRFSWFSTACMTQGRLASAGLIGRGPSDLADGDATPADWQRHLDDLAAHRPFRDVCYRIGTDAGTDVHLLVSGVPVFDESGRFSGYRGVGNNISKQRIAEQQARSARQRLGDAIEGFFGGFALFDAGDRLLLSNRAFRQRFADETGEPAIGQPFEALIRRLAALGRIRPEHGGPANWVDGWLLERQSGDTARTLRIGANRWIEARDYRTRDDGRMLVCTDVTAQRTAADALRRSEASLATAQRIARVGHWEILITSNEMWWSDEVYRLLGCPPRAFEPTFDRFLDAVHPLDRARVHQAIQDSLYAGARYQLVHRIVRSDGSERIVEGEGEVTFDADGVPISMIATFCDTTERRQAERALRDAEDRFRFAFETCPDAVSVCRLHDRSFVEVNPAFTEIVGYDKEALLGRSGHHLGLWPDFDQRQTTMHRLFRDGEFHDAELPFRRKDGEIRTGLLSASLCLINGEPHVFSYLRDITELQRAQADLQTLSHAVEQSSVGMVITDPAGTIEYVNETFTALTGFERNELVGETARMLHSDLTPADAYVELWATITSGANWRGELRNRRRNGQPYWASVLISPVKDDDGRIRNFVGVHVDITEQKLAERELRESEERFRAMAECSLLGLAIERDNRALFVNRTFAQIFGFADPDEVTALPSLSALFIEDDWTQLQVRLVDEEAAGGAATEVTQHLQEYRGRHRDGRIIWLHTQARTIPWNGGEPARQLIVVDITLRKNFEAQLTRQANYDAVTGLPNRTLALDRLRTALASARRHQHGVAVLFVDVDHFKKINDALGHAVGDRFLRQLAHRLKSCIREEDTVARLGGDEFLIILPKLADTADAERTARRILDTVGRPLVLEGQELFVSISLGIAQFPEDGDEADVLLRHADAAMYQAKDQGRGAVRFFTAELNDRMRERIRIEAAMRRALEHGEFALFFQPLIDLSTSEIVGAEALMRWNSNVLGSVAPDRFIPVAEETGQIVQLGAWALRSACDQLARWRAAGHEGIRLCVNVSTRQFRTATLVDTIRQALANHALPPSLLELEITESLLMEDGADVETTLRRLEACGVRLAVDDFGTGYSSLSYLNRFPIDTLKIDRSFTAGIASEGTQAPLVEAMIVMAHRLSLKVIAEGVETMEQIKFLRAQGCDVAQGYYFSRPLPGDEFLSFLEAWPARPAPLAD